MIKLTLADGSRIDLNPNAIAYMQRLPDSKGSEDKEQPKTRIVLMSGEALQVRQLPASILVATGERSPKHEKGGKAKGADE